MHCFLMNNCIKDLISLKLSIYDNFMIILTSILKIFLYSGLVKIDTPKIGKNSENRNQFLSFHIYVSQSIPLGFEQTWSQNLSWSAF